MVPTSEAERRFTRMFNASYDDVLRYCLRRLSVADADDAVSEVFVVAWRRIEAAPQGDEARLWLYGVARNVVRNTHRSRRRSVRLKSKVAGLAPETSPSPEHQVVQSAELQSVLDQLDQLSPNDQEIIRLRAMERLSLGEIGVVLGCSEGAARKRFDRAAKRLQRKVGNPVPTPSNVPCDPDQEVA